MIIAFSYPFSMITKSLVEEKASRVREGMVIMGLDIYA
jgi:hypothetical protein